MGGCPVAAAGILKLYGILSTVVVLVTYIYHLLGQFIGNIPANTCPNVYT
jgi:hypothetical protein